MSEVMGPDAQGGERSRRSRLIGIKLRALVVEHLGRTVDEPVEFSPGAALRHDGAAWVFLDQNPAERLGAAIAWAIRHDCGSLHVIADEGTGVLARRAAEFDMPISIWVPDARTLNPAESAPLVEPRPVPAHHDEFRALIVEGGADPVVAHGVLTGEVRGLEVCRVVDDEYTGATRLAVGVGEHDREAFQMLHGDVPAVESLVRVVDAVARHRRPGAPQHPLNTLGAERLLRWRLEQAPELVGAADLASAPSPVPRRNLKDPVPCVAHGHAADGAPIVVVCSTGIDLDLVPYAADARLAAAGASGVASIDLVLAMPARDRIGLVGEIADQLRHSPSIVSVD